MAFTLTIILVVASYGSGALAQESGAVEKEERELPQNPLHGWNIRTGSVSQSTTPGYFNSTETAGPIGEDVGLWDYVYFGNYP